MRPFALLAALALLSLVPPAAAVAPTPEQVHVTLATDTATGNVTGLVVQWAVSPAYGPTEIPYVTWYENGVYRNNKLATLVGQTTATGVSSPSTSIYAATLDATPGSQVDYFVGAAGVWSATYRIHAPPATGTDGATIVAYGDIGRANVALDGSATGPSPPAAVRNASRLAAPSAQLILGDLAYQHDPHIEPDWNSFMRLVEPSWSSIPTLIAAGNHEYDDSAHFKQFFPRVVLPEDERHYGARIGDVFLVVLDSEDVCNGNPYSNVVDPTPENPCNPWGANTQAIARVETLLTRAEKSGAPWIVVGMHVTPWGRTPRESEIPIRYVWTPLFESHGVDLVLVAHDHLYARTKPILSNGSHVLEPYAPHGAYAEGNPPIYATLGGGGRPLYAFDPPTEARPSWVAFESNTSYHYGLLRANDTELNLTVHSVVPAEGAGANDTTALLDSVRICRPQCAGAASAAPPERSEGWTVGLPLVAVALLAGRRAFAR